ncbi:MAG: glycosyltransferase 87 family protein [Rhodothalassiaceae bacterium]
MRRAAIPGAVALLVALLCLSLYRLPLWFPEHLGSAYIMVHLGLTAAMVLAWRTGLHPHWVLIIGVAARLLLVGTEPFTTHDVARYLWDGAVLLEGLDPYRFHPDHDAVAGLRAVWPTPEEHAAYPTLYPPLALALFALAAVAGPVGGVLVFKGLLAAAGVATLWLGRDLLARRGALSVFPLLALSPILLLETGVGGHVDAVCALSVMAAFWALERQRPGWAGLALGLGAAVKLMPAILIVPIAVSLRWRSGLAVLLGAAAGMAGIYSLAVGAGLVPLGALPVFFEKWRFGAPLFAAVAALWPQSAPAGLAGLGALLIALAGLVARRDRQTGCVLALSAPLLVSPVVFPWYLCVLVPLACLRPGPFILLWLTVAPLSYEVLDRFVADGRWQPQIWPLAVIGAGWIIGLVWPRPAIVRAAAARLDSVRGRAALAMGYRASTPV